MVKSSAKPLHDRISSLKPSIVQNKSQSIDGQQFNHKSLRPGKQLSAANNNLSIYQLRTIDVPIAREIKEDKPFSDHHDLQSLTVMTNQSISGFNYASNASQ